MSAFSRRYPRANLDIGAAANSYIGYDVPPGSETPSLRGIESKGLRGMPEEVQDVFGAALLDAQHCEVPLSARAFGEGLPGRVLKLARDHYGDTFRLAYTVAFPRAVYVLHGSKKKSTRGIGTPLPDLDMVRTRLGGAAEHDREHYLTWGNVDER